MDLLLCGSKRETVVRKCLVIFMPVIYLGVKTNVGKLPYTDKQARFFKVLCEFVCLSAKRIKRQVRFRSFFKQIPFR